ncbi:MAG TPA: LamG-like jellyroll fold domain-containing protein [Candidatus Baltobacteraceae bacterium]|jgi:hypothetical protein|nr:LamG-like jellyroll fold domain-containing protein [Candidatus Baltobacteraceae bacterium]
MKKLRRSSRVSLGKKIACTVSAAALMLGVSSAATVGLHFQESYCNGAGLPDAGYSGFPVTLTAFGIESNGWENLLPMDTGYSGCSGPLGYTLGPELIDTTTATNGLNPLPNGSISVTWFGPTANFDPFYGYAGSPPYYTGGGGLTNPKSGEQEIYATFIRDGINFGPTSSGGDNDQPGYYVDITGLKSLFTNSPFVVELMASGDSVETITNAYVIDVADSKTNLVGYTNTPPVNNTENTAYYQGTGGGLSTGSAPFTNIDEIKIMSVQPVHVAGEYNHAGTISGFILTDKPVVSMSPQPIPVAGPGDSVTLSAYAIGVPPLSYQWRLNGVGIAGATTTSYAISNVTLSSGGNFDLVVTNLYGAATSKVSTVTVDLLTQVPAYDLVYDSNPTNAQNDGVDMGATWLASNSDGTITRTGVMSFGAAETNGISVTDSTNFNDSTGTVSFWMRAAVNNSAGSGASIFCRPTGTAADDFILYQGPGAPGNLDFQAPTGSGVSFVSSAAVGDDDWHFIALTFDQSASGGVALYIDGNLDTTNANGAAWSWTSGQPLQFGYSSDPTWTAYNGLLSDVRYYSTNLTASQISTIFKTGALVDTTDLQMLFQFAAPPGNGFVLSWLEGSAILQSAPTLLGPWSDVNGATSPYTIVPAESQQFFRYKYTPQSLFSNPYLM